MDVNIFAKNRLPEVTFVVLCKPVEDLADFSDVLLEAKIGVNIVFLMGWKI